MSDQIIELPLPNEPENTLSIRLRLREDGNPTYQARRVIPMELRSNSRNPYKTKSLKTADEGEARKLAYQWERQLNTKIDRNEPLDDIPFSRVAADYLRWAEQRSKVADANGMALISANAVKRERTSIARYLMPFFGNSDVRAIKPSDVKRFLEWRLNYYLDGPGAHEEKIPFTRHGKVYSRAAVKSVRPTRSTINKDVVAYSKFIEHARRLFDI